MNDHYRDSFVIDLCQGTNDQIVLPDQSPIGIREGLHYLPIGTWPKDFLCLRHGTVFSRSAEDVQSDFVPMSAPDEPRHVLWQIEFECDHDNCGMRHVLYTTTPALYEEVHIRARIGTTKPFAPCGGHGVEVSQASLRVMRLDR